MTFVLADGQLVLSQLLNDIVLSDYQEINIIQDFFEDCLDSIDRNQPENYTSIYMEE